MNLTGLGTLTFEDGSLDDVPYSIELHNYIDDSGGDTMSSLDGFHGRITLDLHLAEVLVEHGVVLTLTIANGRTLVCQMVDTSGVVVRLDGGTL